MSSSGSGYAASTTVSRQTSLSSAAASSAAAMQAPSTSHEPCRCAPRQHADAQRTRVRRRPRRRTAAPAARRRTDRRARQPEMTSSTAALSRTVRRHDVPDDEPGPRLAVVGTERHAAASRLEAEQPAHAGRDADRAAAVARVRERHHARRDRRRAAAARSAGGPVEVPRVAGGPVSVRFGGRQQAELRRVGLAHDHEPGGAQVCEQVASRGRRCARVRAAAGCRGGAARRPGHRRGPSPGSARRGTDRPARRSASARARSSRTVDHRVELRVHRVDARDRGVDELARRRRRRRARARPARWRRAQRDRRSREDGTATGQVSRTTSAAGLSSRTPAVARRRAGRRHSSTRGTRPRPPSRVLPRRHRGGGASPTKGDVGRRHGRSCVSRRSRWAPSMPDPTRPAKRSTSRPSSMSW